MVNKPRAVSFFIILLSHQYYYLIFQKRITAYGRSWCIFNHRATDEGSSFEYTQEQAQKVEARLIHFYKLKIVLIQDL